jgi:hypothetical protein
MSSAVGSDYQLQVTTPNGDPHTVEAPKDMQVDLFVQQLTPELRLAAVDAAGHPVVWYLHSKATGRALQTEQTLEQNGVQTGDSLYLVRQTVAG